MTSPPRAHSRTDQRLSATTGVTRITNMFYSRLSAFSSAPEILSSFLRHTASHSSRMWTQITVGRKKLFSHLKQSKICIAAAIKSRNDNLEVLICCNYVTWKLPMRLVRHELSPWPGCLHSYLNSWFCLCPPVYVIVVCCLCCSNLNPHTLLLNVNVDFVTNRIVFTLRLWSNLSTILSESKFQI